eukprot:5639388-Amphidinium_carterae.1
MLRPHGWRLIQSLAQYGLDTHPQGLDHLRPAASTEVHPLRRRTVYHIREDNIAYQYRSGQNES